MIKLATASALLALITAGAAFGQTAVAPAGNAHIGALTCSDLEALPPGQQAALIYYAAGYRDGLADGAMASADTSGMAATDTTSSAATSTTSSVATDTTSSAATDTAGGAVDTSTYPGGLALDAQLVLAACATSGTTLLSDVIGTSGGAAGNVGASGSTATGTGSSATDSSSAMDSSAMSSSAPSSAASTSESNAMSSSAQ